MHSNKRRIKKCNVLIKKDTPNIKNILLQWLLQKILENQTFHRIAMFIMVDSYEIDFMKILLFTKSRWDLQYLEVFQPLFIGQEMKMQLLEPALEWP